MTRIVHGFLRSSRPLGATGDGGGQARREVPVLVAESTDYVVEGVLDLAFPEETDGEGKSTVSDFKTDREIAGARSVYEEQARLYGRAVDLATGEEGIHPMTASWTTQSRSNVSRSVLARSSESRSIALSM